MPEEVRLEFATPQRMNPIQTSQLGNTGQPVEIQPQSSIIAPAINELMTQQGGESIPGMTQAQQGYTPQLTVSDINPNYYPDYATGGYEAFGEDPQVAALNNQILAAQGATSPGVLNPNTYVPGLGQPINVGTYSGSVIGSNPIFAATDQYVPMGIADAREKALQDAAVNAAKLEKDKADIEMKLNAFEIPEGPKVKNKNYQRTIDKEVARYVEESIAESKRIYGKDWRRALMSDDVEIGRDFKKGMAQFNYIADRSNQYTDKVATLQKSIEDGEMQTTPYINKLLQDAEYAMGEFKSGDPTTLYELEGRMGAVMNLDNYLKKNSIVTPEMRDIKQSMSGANNKTEYDLYYKQYTGLVDDAANRLADQMFAPGGAYQGKEHLLPRQAVVDAVKARLGEVRKTDIQTVGTPQGGKKAYEDDQEAVIGVDEYGNYTIPGNTKKEYRTGMTISDAEGIEGGIKPGDKVKLSELKTVKTRPDGSIIRDGEGNPIYENKAVWSVKRKETVEYNDGYELKTKEVEKDYVVTADSDGDSRVWLKKDHNTQYKAQQDVSNEAGVKTKTGVEEKEYEDPNRGNRNTRGFLKTNKADTGKSELTKEEEDFFK
jgi:hypothetical protein